MTNENIVLYARLLRDIFQTRNAIEIARKLMYKVKCLDAGNFITANTYRYNDGVKVIIINSKYDDVSKNVLCAHELGHAVFDHKHKNSYKDNNLENEYMVNLFAVALLFDDDSFNIPISKMNNYTLQNILEINIKNPY